MQTNLKIISSYNNVFLQVLGKVQTKNYNLFHINGFKLRIKKPQDMAWLLMWGLQAVFMPFRFKAMSYTAGLQKPFTFKWQRPCYKKRAPSFTLSNPFLLTSPLSFSSQTFIFSFQKEEFKFQTCHILRFDDTGVL